MEPFEAGGPDGAIERLRSAPIGDDRVAAALALAETDSPHAIAALTAALADPSSEVRAVAALVLTDLRDPASIAGLAAVVATWNDPSLRVCRRAALRALAAFKSEAAALELARVLVTGGPEVPLGLDERAALLAVVYAETMGVAAIRVVFALVALLEHEDERTADRAAVLLELFPSEGCRPLARTLRSTRPAGARRRAAQALRVCRQDDAVAALLAALSDPAPSVRVAAKRSLYEMRVSRSDATLAALS